MGEITNLEGSSWIIEVVEVGRERKGEKRMVRYAVLCVVAAVCVCVCVVPTLSLSHKTHSILAPPYPCPPIPASFFSFFRYQDPPFLSFLLSFLLLIFVWLDSPDHKQYFVQNIFISCLSPIFVYLYIYTYNKGNSF